MDLVSRTTPGPVDTTTKKQGLGIVFILIGVALRAIAKEQATA